MMESTDGSIENGGGMEELELFEGMVLTVPSDFENLPQPKEPSADTDVNPVSQSQPLDENLFSDLNICSVSEEQTLHTEETHNSSKHSDQFSVAKQSVNEIQGLLSNKDKNGHKNGGIRRKKRSFRIGYGRDDNNSDDSLQKTISDLYKRTDSKENLTSQDDKQSSSLEIPVSKKDIEEKEGDNLDLRETFRVDTSAMENGIDLDTAQKSRAEVQSSDSVNRDESIAVSDEKESESVKLKEFEEKMISESEKKMAETTKVESDDSSKIKEAKGDYTESVENLSCDTGHSLERPIEKRILEVKREMGEMLEQLQEKAMSLSLSRKVAAQNRRKAAQELLGASNGYRDLEKELEEACEMEDFEKAEKLSESLAAAEKLKEKALVLFKEAESECDKTALKMQEILEMQIQVEKNGIHMLQALHKEATDMADVTIKETEKSVAREMESWQSDKETVELKNMETGLELKVIEGAKMNLRQSIDESVGDDIEVKNGLTCKREMLMKELQDLLALVKAKEKEISDNDFQIRSVDERISSKLSKFEDETITVKAKYESLQSLLGQLEDSERVLSTKKLEIDQSLTMAEQRRSELLQLADEANKEAQLLQDMVNMRKSIASSFMESHESKIKLAKKEEQITSEINLLRQKVTNARSSLQELQSMKVTYQQSVQSMKQRIAFIEKRCPELETEKKVAAAARNFKEAGRVASEAKALSAEKDSISSDMEKTLLDLQNMEEEIKSKVIALQEDESQIILKEREAAMARCERLRLVAASAREEQSVALEVEDLAEAESLLAEADAADSEADKLQEACKFDGEQFVKRSNNYISVALSSTLFGRELSDKNASI